MDGMLIVIVIMIVRLIGIVFVKVYRAKTDLIALIKNKFHVIRSLNTRIKEIN